MSGAVAGGSGGHQGLHGPSWNLHGPSWNLLGAGVVAPHAHRKELAPAWYGGLVRSKRPTCPIGKVEPPHPPKKQGYPHGTSWVSPWVPLPGDPRRPLFLDSPQILFLGFSRIKSKSTLSGAVGWGFWGWWAEDFRQSAAAYKDGGRRLLGAGSRLMPLLAVPRRVEGRGSPPRPPGSPQDSQVAF